MKKTVTQGASRPAPKESLPLIEKQVQDAPPQVHVGVFNPTLLEMPTLAELTALVFIMGFQTSAIHGEDGNGNLVNEQGNTVIPVQLRKFFRLLPARIVKPVGQEGAAA